MDFEELDRQPTPMGEISVRRRMEPTLQVDVYEVKLGDEFLMSSLFTVAEEQLATLGLAAVPGDDLVVVVGGLGLGYTARAVLEDRRVHSLYVVEAVGAVIDWHRRGLLPLSTDLLSDPRCHLVHGDFFEVIAGGSPLEGEVPDRSDAVLVDIDHSPRHLLQPAHASFYTAVGLDRLRRRLRAGGVFGLWSDDAPDREFLDLVEGAFTSCEAHEVTFPNFYTGGESSATVYVAEADDG